MQWHANQDPALPLSHPYYYSFVSVFVCLVMQAKLEFVELSTSRRPQCSVVTTMDGAYDATISTDGSGQLPGKEVNSVPFRSCEV
jgi:hypothetical protein